MEALLTESGDASIEGGPGHSEVACDLAGGLAGFDKSLCVADLTVGEDRAAAAEIAACRTAFGDGIGDAFALDLEPPSGPVRP